MSHWRGGTAAMWYEKAYLVEVGTQIVDLCRVLEQPWPIFFLKLFLSEDHLDVGGGVVRLRVLDIDLAKEIHLEVVGGLLGL